MGRRGICMLARACLASSSIVKAFIVAVSAGLRGETLNDSKVTCVVGDLF